MKEIAKLSEIVQRVNIMKWEHSSALVMINDRFIDISFDDSFNKKESYRLYNTEENSVIEDVLKIDMDLSILPFRAYGHDKKVIQYEFPLKNADRPHSARKFVKLLDERSAPKKSLYDLVVI